MHSSGDFFWLMDLCVWMKEGGGGEERRGKREGRGGGMIGKIFGFKSSGCEYVQDFFMKQGRRWTCLIILIILPVIHSPVHPSHGWCCCSLSPSMSNPPSRLPSFTQPPLLSFRPFSRLSGAPSRPRSLRLLGSRPTTASSPRQAPGGPQSTPPGPR